MVEQSVTSGTLTDADKRNISGFAAAMQLAKQLAESEGRELTLAEDLGDGFVQIKSDAKARLVGKMFIIVDCTFVMSKENKTEFARMHVVTSDDEKFIVSDGAVMGWYSQMKSHVVSHGKFIQLFAPKGLSVSDYEYTDPKTGEISKTPIYSLNTSS